MLYRIKDFEQVYNISENKFRAKDEEFNVRRSVEEVVSVTYNDLQKKNIELTVNYPEELPSMAKGDIFKFK
jgi:signal transduction histidine kinase